MSWEGKIERRRHARAEIKLVVEFTGVDDQGREETTRLETLNLSAGGFYCNANREIPELTRLALRLVFPPFGSEPTGERAIDCEAIVVRCEPQEGGGGGYRFAAAFLDLAQEDRRHIADYVDWHNTVYSQTDSAEEAQAAEG